MLPCQHEGFNGTIYYTGDMKLKSPKFTCHIGAFKKIFVTRVLDLKCFLIKQLKYAKGHKG